MNKRDLEFSSSQLSRFGELFGVQGLQERLVTEQKALEAQMLRGARRAILLREMKTLESLNTPLKKAIHERYESWGLEAKNLSTQTLKAAYLELTGMLNRFFTLKESYKTQSQINFSNWFKEESRLRFETGLWIGNHEVDFVLPNVRTDRSVGIIIEIDGGIHNSEIKGLKDSIAETFFRRFLKTPTMRISNDNVTWKRVAELARGFGQLRMTDTASKKRWWDKVYILTLAFGGAKLSNEQWLEFRESICRHLNLTAAQLDELERLTSLKNTKKFFRGSL